MLHTVLCTVCTMEKFEKLRKMQRDTGGDMEDLSESIGEKFFLIRIGNGMK